MSVSVLSAAKRLGEKSGWDLSNLEMQKMCYFAHMYYMGTHDGDPLVSGQFEAWAFGPVHPELYRVAKRFGADCVEASAFRPYPTLPNDFDGSHWLDVAVEQLPRSRLVGIAHWKQGAWFKNYQPRMRGIKIPNEDIIVEYNNRKNAAQEARDGRAAAG